jgi:hypothetical protein
VKVGDLVRIRNSLSYHGEYESCLRKFIGHTGIVTKIDIPSCGVQRIWVWVHVSGDTRKVFIDDLEVISESR